MTEENDKDWEEVEKEITEHLEPKEEETEEPEVSFEDWKKEQGETEEEPEPESALDNVRKEIEEKEEKVIEEKSEEQEDFKVDKGEGLSEREEKLVEQEPLIDKPTEIKLRFNYTEDEQDWLKTHAKEEGKTLKEVLADPEINKFIGWKRKKQPIPSIPVSESKEDIGGMSEKEYREKLNKREL